MQLGLFSFSQISSVPLCTLRDAWKELWIILGRVDILLKKVEKDFLMGDGGDFSTVLQSTFSILGFVSLEQDYLQKHQYWFLGSLAFLSSQYLGATSSLDQFM